LRRFVETWTFSAAVLCSSFFPEAALRAAELTDSELPAVAADSQLDPERAPEARARSKDERWLKKPFAVGLSTILGATPGSGYVFAMPGVELSYALPYVSLGGTLGYLGGMNATLACARAPASWRCRCLDARRTERTVASESYLLGRVPGGDATLGSCALRRRRARRTEAGFFWRAQVGFWGLLARGGASCTPDGGYPCYVSDLPPGVVITQELTLGAAF
jgi:hypothetical protein